MTRFSKHFPSKTANLASLVSGYLLSRISGQPVHTGMPAAVSIEPTNRCNLSCPECPSGSGILTRERGFLEPGLYRDMISQLLPGLAWLNLYFQGEPYLHPDFHDFVSYAAYRGIFVSTSTNGHYLDPGNSAETVRSGLGRLVISVDGTDQESYGAYRKGGSLDRVVEGIRNLSAAKNSAGAPGPEIVIQFLVLRTNEHQCGLIKRKGMEWGADRVVLKSAQFYDFEHGNPLMPSPGKYSRYEGNGRFRLKNTLPRHCFRMWSSCVITWDGKVVPCCYDKDARYRYGSLGINSLKEIWKGETSRAFRKRILREREKIDICMNCPEGTGAGRWL